MERSDPRCVLIETSGRVGCVALAEGNRLLEVRKLDEARRHARDLAPTLAELLRKHSWQPRDVAAVLISRGPGSYTGLRVGIMSAKAFAYATGCKLIAPGTFPLVARQFPGNADQVEVIVDAQQGKIYHQLFARSSREEPFAAVTELVIVHSKDWLQQRQTSTAVSGSALRLFEERLPAGTERALKEFWDPLPESLLAVGLERYRAGPSDDIWSLEPVYLRPSSAEEKAEQVTNDKDKSTASDKATASRAP